MNTAIRRLSLLPLLLMPLLAGKAWAGNLTIVGNCTVTTNLTYQGSTIGTNYSLARYSSDDGLGVAVHRYNDACSDGYVCTMAGWCGRTAIQAFSDTNQTVTELALNVNGGQVSVNMTSGTDGFDVNTNAVFLSTMTVDGKFTTHGAVDPPFLLLDAETQTDIAQRVASDVPADKQGGAVLFFNPGTKRLEIYLPTEGTFYDLAGNVITNLPLPTVSVTVGQRIWFDPETGNVVTNETVRAPRYQIRSGYQFDSTDGQFYQISSGANSNSTPRVLVPESQAVVLRP